MQNDLSKHNISKQAKGGRARAKTLSADQRSEIAKNAAETRWAKDKGLPEATHVGDLSIVDHVISCAVLGDHTRLLTQSSFLKAIGRSRTPKAGTGAIVAEVPTFLAAKNLKPYLSKDLIRSTTPIKFLNSTGRVAYGYKAEILPKVCEVYLQAKDDLTLTKSQEHIAERCYILIRGLAHVGIIALVDEATGYQDDRARDELNKILEAYIREELLPWTRKFPNVFFKEIYRLHGWKFVEGNHKRPQYVGKLINRLIYEQLPKGVLEELQSKNPKTQKGYRKHKHFQFLSDNVGHPHLDKVLASVLTVFRLSNSKDEMWRHFKRVFAQEGQQLEFELFEDSEALETVNQ